VSGVSPLSSPSAASLGPLPGQVAPGGVPAALLPEPTISTGDALSSLYKLMSDRAETQQESAKTELESTATTQKKLRAQHQEAVERARKAAEDQGGFFESIGVGGLVGIAVSNPWLVVADMGMHMAKLTPDALRDFEKAHLDEVANGVNAFGALGHAKVLLETGLGGPQAVAALAALGGLLVKETNILGDSTSDWVGRGMMLGGSDALGTTRTAAVGFVADKEGAVADEIRDVEKETQAYTEYVSYAAMGLAAAGAIAGTFGTATFPVVLVGVALSGAGVVVTETNCLGDDWSKLVGFGLMASGALISGVGVGAAAAGASSAAKAAGATLTTAGNIVDGATMLKNGTDTIHGAAVQHEVDHANADAKEHHLAAKRLDRVIERLIETARDAKDGFRRTASTIQKAIEQDAQTPMIVAGAIRG
jgi:hypothetical protein